MREAQQLRERSDQVQLVEEWKLGVSSNRLRLLHGRALALAGPVGLRALRLGARQGVLVRFVHRSNLCLPGM